MGWAELNSPAVEIACFLRGKFGLRLGKTGGIQMNKFGFTRTRLEQIPVPSSGKVRYYDSNCPGLALIARANGTKRFYFVKKIDGRMEEMSLGEFSGAYGVSVETARGLVASLQTDIKKGINPAQAKRRLREEDTMDAFFELYQKRHEKRERSKENDRKLWTVRIAPFIGKKKVSEITRADIIEVRDSIARTRLNSKREKIEGEGSPIQANRAVALLSHMMNRAVEWNFRADHPATGISRAKKEKSRRRFLRPDELARFLQAVQNYPNALFRDFFMLSILTGARRSNVQAMKWADIDFTNRIWSISEDEAKGGEEIEIPLTDEAIEILQRRKEGRTSVFVFPGRGKGGHLVEPKSAWKKILETAGLEDVRLHDIRRTTGSYAASLNHSLPIIGQILGHKSQQTTAVYARLNTDPVREALQSTVSAMLEIGKQARPEKITKLRAK